MRHFLAICVSLCLLSCSNNKYGDHPPYPTAGQILVNGQPAKGAQIVFHHVGDWGERSIVPQAWTDDEGRFSLSTYDTGDGAPAGEYRVTIFWPAYRLKQLGPDKLSGKFANPESSGLTAKVEKGKNEVPVFDLKARVVDAKPKSAAETRHRAPDKQR